MTLLEPHLIIKWPWSYTLDYFIIFGFIKINEVYIVRSISKVIKLLESRLLLSSLSSLS